MRLAPAHPDAGDVDSPNGCAYFVAHGHDTGLDETIAEQPTWCRPALLSCLTGIWRVPQRQLNSPACREWTADEVAQGRAVGKPGSPRKAFGPIRVAATGAIDQPPLSSR
jgi:hypothetical protein